MHGKLVEDDERFVRPDVLLAEAVAEALEAGERIAALFDSDVEDSYME